MRDETKLAASDVIRAAEWLYQWMPKRGFGLWLIKKLYPSACLERFNETMRDWNFLSRADRHDLLVELRAAA